MMDIERSRRTIKEINLTSLIDVMFMLMIFFILTTSYVDIEALKLAVVENDATGIAKIINSHELVLLRGGETFVNGSLVYYGDLEDKLEVMFKLKPAIPISVKCDEAVNVQMLVEVLDMVKRTGGKDVRIARLNDPIKGEKQ